MSQDKLMWSFALEKLAYDMPSGKYPKRGGSLDTFNYAPTQRIAEAKYEDEPYWNAAHVRNGKVQGLFQENEIPRTGTHGLRSSKK